MRIILFTILFITALAVPAGSRRGVRAGEAAPSAEQVAAKIDAFLESHWSTEGVQPAKRADDATFLRRITLDLTGRIPTPDELEPFLADKSSDKRRKRIDKLLGGPEFPLHFGNVLDRMIQTRYSGNPDFVDYLRRSVRDGKAWDQLFRELMLGPWDSDPLKPANRFLDKRAKTSDVLAVDAARVFFGVDISCAKCHDHPLVDDWTQKHFYGMVAFFNRTTGGKGKVGEKEEGEVKFLGPDGKEQVARMMFLSGQVIEEPGDATDPSGDARREPFSRREQLVHVALEQEGFLSRSVVNRMWQYFFGLGIVEPVDQMHSGNEPSVPGLLPWLAEDFASSGYDLRRLVKALVSTRAYQLSSRWQQDAPAPRPSWFAAARLRPLSPRQLAFSLLLATGNERFEPPTDVQDRVQRYAGVAGLRRIEQYLTMEQRADALIGRIDAPRADFQTSVVEALFMSNNPVTQELIQGRDDNLPQQLSAIDEEAELVATAVRTILSREPTDSEQARLVDWFANQEGDRQKACEQLVWALVTSAEFRFNH